MHYWRIETIATAPMIPFSVLAGALVLLVGVADALSGEPSIITSTTAILSFPQSLLLRRSLTELAPAQGTR